MLQFDLSPLIGARPGKRLDFFLDEGPQQLEDIQVTFLRGQIQFTRVQGGILVQGDLEAAVQVECTRCLEQFSQPITLELEEVIGLVGTSGPDVIYSVDEEGWFHAVPLLREHAWISLPIKPICRPNCRGHCPECGANLNLNPCNCHEERIDPRLAALAKFYEED